MGNSLSTNRIFERFPNGEVPAVRPEDILASIAAAQDLGDDPATGESMDGLDALARRIGGAAMVLPVVTRHDALCRALYDHADVSHSRAEAVGTQALLAVYERVRQGEEDIEPLLRIAATFPFRVDLSRPPGAIATVIPDDQIAAFRTALIEAYRAPASDPSPGR